MERVIEWLLREHAEKYGKFQYVYIGTRGTDIALSTLVNMIESAILRKQLCQLIFKALLTIWHFCQ